MDRIELLKLAAHGRGLTFVRVSDDGRGIMVHELSDAWNPIDNNGQAILMTDDNKTEDQLRMKIVKSAAISALSKIDGAQQRLREKKYDEVTDFSL